MWNKIKKKNIYVNVAYPYNGNIENGYLCGVFDKMGDAIYHANQEHVSRGGSYNVKVFETPLNAMKNFDYKNNTVHRPVYLIVYESWNMDIVKQNSKI